MSTPSIGLALIARDEEANLPHLLASVQGAFDEIVLVDTGSKDGTRDLFQTWAADEVAEGRLRDYRTAEMSWGDDFSAVRNFADSLLDCQWACWADCDDVLLGAEHLRTIAAQAPLEVSAFVATYDYAADEHGNCICRLRRERLVRAGTSEWVGRVHEAQVIDGALAEIPAEAVRWVHRKAVHGSSSVRNRRILRSWLVDEPENPRVLRDLCSEELGRGKPKLCLRYARRYLALRGLWDEERAWVTRKACQAQLVLERPEEAIERALSAIRTVPAWPDSYLTMAEAHFGLGEPEKAAHWAGEVLRIGEPETMLITDPTDYSVQPYVILAGALGAQGKLDEAIEAADAGLAVQPTHHLLVPTLRKLRADRKRESTAGTVVSLAEVLLTHDEQLKARAVLDAVPYFATDHPRVVAMRSAVRERVDPLLDPEAYAGHYETGGSKPEDWVEDPIAVGDALPRCAFLLEGLEDQAREAA